MFQNKKQLQYLWIFKPELNDIAKRIAEDHTKWMKEAHTKEGDKALLMLNWSIGPEFKDGNKTGNMSLILTEVYENQAGIDDHFQQAQNNGASFRDDFKSVTPAIPPNPIMTLPSKVVVSEKLPASKFLD